MTADSHSRPDPLDEILAAYLRAVENGENPSRDDLLARHPDLAGDLQEFFADHDRMNRLAQPLCEATLASPAIAAAERIRYFGDYEVLEEIARGGMGVVFKARQISLNRIVAIKMILSGSLASPADVERFHTEARAAAKLDHPGIVPIFEVGQHQGQHYFSMGFVDGISLSAKVAPGPLPARLAAELMQSVCESVQYAHDKGVIHRDLKPGNILLDSQGNPRVSDFGLAKLTDSGSDLTATWQVMGTANYIPPEQAAGFVNTVGRLSDVYSLGAVLYCLVTGRPPFQAVTRQETLMLVQTREPVAPKQLNPGIPRDLNTIVLKCLEKDPTRRYQSALEVAQELQRYLTGEPIVARPISLIERSWRWCRRRPLVPSLFAAVLAVSLLAGLLYRHAAEQSLRREVALTVEATQKSRGPAVPINIRKLQSLPRKMVVEEVRRRYDDSDSASPDKLILAFTLAEYGEIDVEFICSQFQEAAPDEVDNIVTAFRHDRHRALKAIHDLAERSQSDEPDWRLKARLAVIALHLGDDGIAAEMCRIDKLSDPAQRAVFIDGLSRWHGNLAGLKPSSRALDDHAFRSGLCLGLAGVDFDHLSPEEKNAWQPSFVAWYKTAPDAVTHSAANLALRRWNIDLPELPVSNEPAPNRDWFVNAVGMTMLKVAPGTFEMGEMAAAKKDEQRRQVTLTHAYYLCDREVSVEQFEKFLGADGWRSKNGPAVRSDIGLYYDNRPWCPVASLTWFEAISFCNWLSEREGRSRCYKLMAGDVWTCDLSVSGYRLPTEAEWEFACRAGTATRFSFGDDQDGRLFANYGTIDRHHFTEGWGRGQKLPNDWGFFDMYGNVSEWCGDWYQGYGGQAVFDPEGAIAGDKRVERGGGYSSRANECGSGVRSAETPDKYFPSRGFRVVLSLPHSR